MSICPDLLLRLETCRGRVDSHMFTRRLLMQTLPGSTAWLDSRWEERFRARICGNVGKSLGLLWRCHRSIPREKKRYQERKNDTKREKTIVVSEHRYWIRRERMTMIGCKSARGARRVCAACNIADFVALTCPQEVASWPRGAIQNRAEISGSPGNTLERSGNFLGLRAERKQ